MPRRSRRSPTPSNSSRSTSSNDRPWPFRVWTSWVSDSASSCGTRRPFARRSSTAPTSTRIPSAAPGHNERLEFLGDAVIGLVVSRLLYDRFPDEDEGLLTARRAALVNRDALAALGLRTRAGPIPPAGPGRGRRPGAPPARRCWPAPSRPWPARSSCREGFGRHASDWLRAPLRGRCRAPVGTAEPPKSAKSRLQEWTQREHRIKAAL